MVILRLSDIPLTIYDQKFYLFVLKPVLRHSTFILEHLGGVFASI